MLDELPAPERGIFCNRTLNLRSIKAIGYDMDYTLVHYHVDVWEERAYAHTRDALAAKGWPVASLQYQPERVIRGLVIDTELGNLVKANRFGYVHRAAHGTQLLDFDVQRNTYAQTFVDLREPRWVFMNTLFSLSEACLYGQLVDLLDAGQLPGVMGYADLYAEVRNALDSAHMEGQLKAEILADPERFVDLDPDLALTLMDQREAGKQLVLITNSEWAYTREMMAFALDRYLPEGRTWRDLFDLVVVSARKPAFFEARNPFFRIVDEDRGLLEPVVGAPDMGGLYLGGSAAGVEQALGLSGAELLYVGDHIFADVNVSKSLLRWRTAVVLRELEDDVRATSACAREQQALAAGMAKKQELELAQAQVRLATQRKRRGYGPQVLVPDDVLEMQAQALRERLHTMDAELAPLAKASGELANPTWGLLMRAGNDKSHLARQVERKADIYLSRVSNFLLHTPYLYLRSPRSSLPHDALPG